MDKLRIVKNSILKYFVIAVLVLFLSTSVIACSYAAVVYSSEYYSHSDHNHDQSNSSGHIDHAISLIDGLIPNIIVSIFVGFLLLYIFSRSDILSKSVQLLYVLLFEPPPQLKEAFLFVNNSRAPPF